MYNIDVDDNLMYGVRLNSRWQEKIAVANSDITGQHPTL
jgi:hypothetical protein